MDEEQRARLVSNVAGHVTSGVSEPIVLGAFEYWRNIDRHIGESIEQAVRNGGCPRRLRHQHARRSPPISPSRGPAKSVGA